MTADTVISAVSRRSIRPVQIGARTIFTTGGCVGVTTKRENRQ
jgi:hypothetical protein